MKNLILAICCALTLTACAQPAAIKTTKNSDIRTISGMGMFGGNVALTAAQACDQENKKLSVISTTTQNGMYSGTSYPVIVFKCVP